MRLSRVWRTWQIKEGVTHRGQRPRWITPCEICRILHILWKPNSIIALLLIQNISSFLIKGVSPLRSLFFRSPNITQPCPQVFLVNGPIISRGLHFWRHFDVIGSIIFGRLHFWHHWFNMAKILSKFGEQQLVMVNYARGFNQSETGKYFEWIIIIIRCYNIPSLKKKKIKTIEYHFLVYLLCLYPHQLVDLYKQKKKRIKKNMYTKC